MTPADLDQIDMIDDDGYPTEAALAMIRGWNASSEAPHIGGGT